MGLFAYCGVPMGPPYTTNIASHQNYCIIYLQNVRENRPLYARPCSAGAQWIPRVVDRTDRRATTFTMSLSRQPPVKRTLNSCGTAHLVMLCDCLTTLCKEKIGTDKDLLHADPVQNASPLFFFPDPHNSLPSSRQ